MRAREWLKQLTPQDWLKAALGVLAAAAAIAAAFIAQSGDSSDGQSGSQAAAKCPTFDLPQRIPRGVWFAVGTADHFEPGETVQLVISPGAVPLQARRGPDIYVRDSGSFSGTQVVVPGDAPVGSVRITAKRQQASDCDEPSVDVVIT